MNRSGVKDVLVHRGHVIEGRKGEAWHVEVWGQGSKVKREGNPYQYGLHLERNI